MKTSFNFFGEVSRRLIACGYKAHGEGVFTRDGNGAAGDWLSVSGNSFFYIASAGVVFPELSCEMRDSIPTQLGIEPLDDISPSLVPFVFSPVNHYVQLPTRGQNPSASSPLSYTDAEELAECLCEQLSAALRRFHSLEQAVLEVENTLDTGGAKVFILILAYLKLGNKEAASSFAQRAMDAFKSNSTRRVYQGFLRNVQVSHNLPASFFPI